MLKSKAKWIFLNEEMPEEQSSVTDNLFAQRNITSKEEREAFLNPEIDELNSPENFEQMEIAYTRIMQAIEAGEQIVVYGDYDADGVTSTALLMKVLHELEAFCHFYIPNRFDEGYGLNKPAIEKLAEEGVSLMITVDTGIAAVEETAYANELGMDVIITDHHEVHETLPEAVAIIHPDLSPNYTFKPLAGVGIAFQLGQQLLGRFPEHLLDLVAVGTVADLVPLIGENRVLTTYGLNQLRKTSNLGLKALMETCRITDEVTEREIGFALAPRINAVGRLQNASLAVDLLISEDEEEVVEIVKQVDRLNRERQQIVKEIIDEAEQRVNLEDGVLILYDRHWNEGVLGIAASRLVQKHDRPVIMLTYKEETNELKGSARSVPSFNLFEACSEIIHLFTNFGGHSQAAGMTFTYDHLAEIQQYLNECIFEQVKDRHFQKEIVINQSITLEQMTEGLVEEIHTFAPFGMDNEQPIFHLKANPSQIMQIGQDKNHLKLQFKQEDVIVEAIGFRIGHLYHFISEHVDVSLVGKLQLNEWNGNKTVQLLIEDIAIEEWQLFDFRGRQNRVDVTPYFTHDEKNIIVVKEEQSIEEITELNEKSRVISYNCDIKEEKQIDTLFLYDLPNEIKQLEHILQYIKPNNIHLSYHTDSTAYLELLPTREDFKWLYGYFFQHEPVDIKRALPQMMQMKRWTRERLIFMVQVFLDLQFITIENSLVTINKNSERADLQSSIVYQQKIEQSKIEKLLYYSSYNELKQWFTTTINEQHEQEEELLHEL